MRDFCGEDGLELLHIPTRQSRQHHLIDMLFHMCLQAPLQEYLITAAVLTAHINVHLLRWPAIAALSNNDPLISDWLIPVGRSPWTVLIRDVSTCGMQEERQNNIEAARQAYQSGRARCMHSIALWRAAATLEWKAGSGGRARALLEQARLKNPANEHLWLAAVRTEQQLGGPGGKGADALMARALQVWPCSLSVLPPY